MSPSFACRFMSQCSKVVSQPHRRTNLLAALLVLCWFPTSHYLAAAIVSPTSLGWSSVTVGSAGGQKSVTLTNSDATSMTIGNVAITGPNAAEFLIFSKTCGSSLAASASCTATILFKPAATGTRTATLGLTDTATNSPQTVALSGMGTTSTGTGSVAASPSSLTWTSVPVGGVGGQKAVTLMNSGTAAINITSIAISGMNAADFAIYTKTCSSTLAASASCTATILFKPAASGSRTATLSFTDTITNSPQTTALSGMGIGFTGGVTASPSSLSFGSLLLSSGGTSLTATLINGTAASITVGSIAVSGPNASDFLILSKTCGSSLAAAASCTATIQFKPATTGNRTATLTFTDAASNSPQSVALSGAGTIGSTGGSISISPSRLTWGSGTIGTLSPSQSVTVLNNSSSAISIASIALTSTDPQDFTISNTTCGTILDAGASCAVTVAFKPTAVGTRVALLTLTDGASDSPQTVAVSGNQDPGGALSASITVDFSSRSGTQLAVPPGMLSVQYLESLPDAASRSYVAQAGFRSSRLHANIPLVYATTTPTWNAMDSAMRSLQAIGVHPILEMDGTPTWLQPSPLVCKSAPTTSMPTDLNRWAQLAAAYVAHFDKTFPGLVLEYEIWNEPNTANLCSTNKLVDYLNIYAAAAPIMKAQAKADGVSIKIGGPAGASIAMPSLLIDPRTAPYVDFYSYHAYLGSGTQIKQGMSWDGAGGTPSLLSMILDPSSGERARYMQAVAVVKSAHTPLGAKTPIYYSEYNDDWSFSQDCCRNSTTYSPLFNSLTVAQILNSAYVGANQLPAKMVYFAAASRPFCLFGIISASMDCSRSDTLGSKIAPYPQLYTYQLISAPGYLDLVDGAHMAQSITLSSAASSQGLVVTSFYTPSTNSILIVNPMAQSFGGVTVQLNNSGMSSPQVTLFTLNSVNTKLSSWPASMVPVANGSQATFDIPPYSVVAIALK